MPQFQKNNWGGKGGGKGFAFKVQHPDKTVWLCNLVPGTSHTELMPVMKQVGNCKRVQVGSKGNGFAFFSSAEEAQAAIASLNGSFVNGSSIQVDSYTKRSGGGKSKQNTWGGQTSWGGKKAWTPQFQK